MALRIEDYALIGDMHSCALVGNNGSVDWLCWPRFDSDACFAALLGDERHGRWSLSPTRPRRVQRRYRNDTLILETDIETDDGSCVRIVDFMPPREHEPLLVRQVCGLRGRTTMRMHLALQFGYGDRTPWLNAHDHGAMAMAGPDAVRLQSDVPIEISRHAVASEFSVAEGERLAFVLEWHPSFSNARPSDRDAAALCDKTERFWQGWIEQHEYEGPWRDAVVRSLITLKALTYSPTGGIVAAATTSLPEHLGGVRNWDYRFCWIRDATFSLLALMHAGYYREARAWRDWLVRAIAGEPEEMQIAYGIAGERRIPELELPWLPGYEGSRPVRIGNAASKQLQLDVYGEAMDCLHQARRNRIETKPEVWPMQRELLDFLESAWERPDSGMWEMRGKPRHFTSSKVMAWVAVDRTLRDAETFQLPAPLERWRALRSRIHAQVCERGFDANKNSFVQAYGEQALDASLLMIPLVGFLPIGDPRVRGTIDAICGDLVRGGFVYRYDTRNADDGLPSGEGVFLACSLWLADNYILLGRHDDAREYFERVLGLCNDCLLYTSPSPRDTR